MTFRNVFAPDPRPPLALLHSPHMALLIHELELVTDVNEINRESAWGSAT
jgi:hypothetical protein